MESNKGTAYVTHRDADIVVNGAWKEITTHYDITLVPAGKDFLNYIDAKPDYEFPTNGKECDNCIISDKIISTLAALQNTGWRIYYFF